MNIERSPVVNDEVLFRRDCNDSHLWMLPEQLVTNRRPPAGVVKRNDHEIWQGSLYAFGNVRLLANFPDNFNIGLIRECCEDQLSHEPRTICHEDPDSFFHCVLRVRLIRSTKGRLVSVHFFSYLGKDSKNVYTERLVRVGSCTKLNLRDTKNDPIRCYSVPTLELSAKGFSGV